MLGILLAAISSAFDEITDSTGKKKISDGLESYYTFGFLTQFLSALFITPIGILFYFDLSKSRGMLLVLLVAILAAIDTGLYKYDISHFNSVESEQAIISLIISLYFFLTATLIRGENPLAFLRQKIYMAQASSSGIAYVVGSFAYLYASASVITAARRGFSVLFSILTGTFYFKERGFFVRTLLFIIILIGLMLLI